MKILSLSRFHAPATASVLSLIAPAPAPASISFTEHYDNLSVDSKVTAEFNLNGIGPTDYTAEARLRGRVDVELVLSDAGPTPRLEAFRIKRVTLRMDPLQASAMGFTGMAQDFGVHMGDGSGGEAGPWASFSIGLGTDAHAWFQGLPNRAGFSGTFRVTGPLGLDELIDCSQLQEPEFTLSGQWELQSFGTESRFSLSMTRFESIDAFPRPIPVTLRVVLSQTKPYLIPQPPVTYAEWAMAQGLAGPAALPDQNPDGDSLTNLAEYACGTNPQAAAAVPAQVETVMVDGRPAFAFIRRDDRSDLAWHLQFSDDLKEWKTLASSVAGSDVAGVSGGIVLEDRTLAPNLWRMVVRDPAYVAASPKRYARLMFEQR